MKALIAHDGELACVRHEVNQDGVAMAGVGHAQLEEPFLREGQRISSLAMRHIDAEFAGALAFGLGDGADDPGFIQSVDELFRFHIALPAPAGAPSAKAPAPARKASARQAATAAAAPVPAARAPPPPP